jgi:hypothetical protein
MDLQTFVEQGWSRHADDPQGVDRQLRGLVLAPETPGAEIAALARLAHHVQGEHLAQWAAAIEFQQRLAALAGADETAQAASRRFIAALALAGGIGDDPRRALGTGDAIWVGALAAASLAPHDAGRAGVLLRDAVAGFDAAGLPATDPCTRALAVCGNNLAAGLEELPERTPEARALMIDAASAGRRFWALAGTWLETERAEYRLAQTWLAAGDPARARQHAEACLALVREHGDVPLERFFGLEALCRAARVGGNAEAAAAARDRMQAVFDQLAPDDQGWCRATLDRLAA